MFVKFLVCFMTLLASGHGHDEYIGSCPKFPAMSGFDWNEFREGRWYAMEKFGTTQSECFTYDFGEDEIGHKFIEQNSVLKAPKRLSVSNKYRYKGRLDTTSSSEPANMVVRFPLNILGRSSFVVMDTDYDNYALICTCQSKNILSLITFHRRSCTILQREPVWNPTISKQLHDLLNEKVPTGTGNEKTDHDFDRIDHDNCNYADDGKGIQIDVDKILGIGSDAPGLVTDLGGPDYAEYGPYNPNAEVELIPRV